MQFYIGKIKLARELYAGYEFQTSFFTFPFDNIKTLDSIMVRDTQCPKSRIMCQFYKFCGIQIPV